MATTIKLKNGSGAPLAGDLVQGEPALDLTNKRLYTEDSGGTVIEVGTNPSTLTVDTTTLVVDAANNRVGIGTTSPSELVHILTQSGGATTTPLLLQNNQSTANTAVELRLAPSTQPNDIGSTARWSAIKAENTGTGQGTELSFWTNASSTDPSERMRIDSSGNVGIGTTSPGEKLDVNGTIQVISSGNQGLAAQIYTDSAGNMNLLADHGDNGGGDHIFRNGSAGTELVRILNTGNVGIGTDDPVDILHIKKTDADAEITLETSNTGGDARLRMKASSSGISSLQFQDENDSNVGFLNYDHSTNSMQFRTNDSEKMRLDNSGNVGIGTDSPDTLLHVGTTSVAGNVKLAKFSASNTNANAQIDFTNSANTAVWATIGSPQANHFSIETNGSERMRILASGGITFNGDTSTDNALDDYEEGTWTPAVNSGTIGSAAGTYTKIGRQVFLQAYLLDWSDYSTSSDISISGLPFTSSSDSTSVGSVMYRNINNSDIAQLTPYIGNSIASMRLYISKNQGQGWELLEFDMFDAGLGDMYIAISYFV